MLGRYLNTCEDSLTAAVFSQLLHLPTELWWNVLREAVYTEQLPTHPGELEEIEFQPKWCPDGTRNSSYIEPDLFLRFPALDLIIEAKRWEHSMQDREQWRREIIAYGNECDDEEPDREVCMIAIGGLVNMQDEQIAVSWTRPGSCETNVDEEHELSCPVHMCRWTRLLEECLRLSRDLERIRYVSSEIRAHQRILHDLVDLFASHGFQTGSWYRDLIPQLPRLEIDSKWTHDLFRSIQSTYS